MNHLSENDYLDLLSGLLSPRTQRALLAHLAVCPTCESALQLRAGERERWRVRARELGAVSSARDPVSDRPLAESVSSTAPIAGDATGWVQRLLDVLSPPRWVAVGAAAAAMALLLLVMPGGRPPYSELSRPLLPYDEEIVLRAPSGPVPQPIVDGLKAYDAGDLASAEILFESTTAEGVAEWVRRVYLGSVLVLRAEYARAAEVLESVDLTRVPEPWTRETRWNLYLALRGSGRHEEATRVLDEMTELPGALGDRARQHRETMPR